MCIRDRNSIELAVDGNLIIFGIIPSYPATGYGYIKAENQLRSDCFIANKVEKFIEKPDLKTAEILFKNKKYSWNSGMFVFQASTILEELSKFTSDIVENCEECLRRSKFDLDFLRLDESSFSRCPEISIDIAVLEKTQKAFVLPMDCGWDDIGNYESLWNISKKDLDGNTIRGNVIAKNTKGSLIRGEEKLLVSLGNNL